MPRPMTQDLLLSENHKEYAALTAKLNTLTPEQMILPGALGDWSVKDTLAHLYEWQCMLRSWYAAGQRGENPPTPAEGYKWNQLPALNQNIRERYQDWSLSDILQAFHQSHQEMQSWIESLSETELFTPGYASWMRSNTLAAYINSAAASHYRWARKEIRIPS